MRSPDEGIWSADVLMGERGTAVGKQHTRGQRHGSPSVHESSRSGDGGSLDVR